MTKSVTVFAPATIANIVVGFDILGMAIPNLGDKVTVSKIDSGVTIECNDPSIPTDPKKNTAGLGILKLIENRKLDCGFHLKIEKGIPIASGLGGSAACSAAAIFGVSKFFDISEEEMAAYALEGEKASTGSYHGDNVLASLFGGLIASCELGEGLETFHVEMMTLPEGIKTYFLHQNVLIPTSEARASLSDKIELKKSVKANARLLTFISACFSNNADLLVKTLQDDIIEPQRKHLIPNYDELSKIFYKNEAYNFNISGAGPTVFGFFPEDADFSEFESDIKDFFGDKFKDIIIGEVESLDHGTRLI